MRRRGFISSLGAVAAFGALPAYAQPSERIRRIGVLHGGAEKSAIEQARHAALLQGLRELGWIEGRNVRIDYRFGEGNAAAMRKGAAELVALAPDVIASGGNFPTDALLRETRSVPIVFAIVPDPVGSGFVKSLARPGGNATGFMQGEYNLSGKWLELLKQIAPNLTRAAVLRDAKITAAIAQFAVIQSVAPSVGVDVRPVAFQDAGEIERDIAEFAQVPNGGLIVTSSPLASIHRDLIIALAARYKLPAVYPIRDFVEPGGLISYGANYPNLFHQAAGYVDRILKGDKPADLPVQVPTKYELVINLKAAKTIGLTVPPSLLARAVAVFE
jgi:putative ABC transport system substrate-binding protein